jgi:hypothetical protein
MGVILIKIPFDMSLFISYVTLFTNRGNIRSNKQTVKKRQERELQAVSATATDIWASADGR